MIKKPTILIASLSIGVLAVVAASVLVYLQTNQNQPPRALSHTSSASSDSSVISQNVTAITITWLDKAQSADVENVLQENGLWESAVKKLADIYEKSGELYWKNGHPKSASEAQSELKDSSTWYLLGSVENGPLSGSKLYDVSSHCLDLDDLCIDTQHKILATKGKQLLRLSNYSGNAHVADMAMNMSNSVMKITNMDTPDTLQIPGSLIPFTAVARTYSDIETDTQFSSVLTDTATQAEVRLDNSDGCFVATNHDGSLTFYKFNYPKSKDGSLDITWNDGKKNTYDYSGSFNFDDCNAPKPCNPSRDMNPSNGYEQIGTTSWGEPVYREALAANTTKEEDIQKSAPDTFEAYRVYNLIPQGQVPFQQLYDGYAVIYFKDPLGQYQKFLRREFEMSIFGCEPADDYREYERGYPHK